MQMKISKSIKYKLHLAATTIFWDLMLRGANLLLLMHFHSSKNGYVHSEEGSKLLQRRYSNSIPPQRSATLFFNSIFFLVSNSFIHQGPLQSQIYHPTVGEVVKKAFYDTASSPTYCDADFAEEVPQNAVILAVIAVSKNL